MLQLAERVLPQAGRRVPVEVLRLEVVDSLVLVRFQVAADFPALRQAHS